MKVVYHFTMTDLQTEIPGRNHSCMCRLSLCVVSGLTCALLLCPVVMFAKTSSGSVLGSWCFAGFGARFMIFCNILHPNVCMCPFEFASLVFGAILTGLAYVNSLLLTRFVLIT